VLLDESRLGYPEHFWLAIGHLAEAESESLEDYPDIAQTIREHRTALIADSNYPFNVVKLIGEIDGVRNTIDSET
jgi:hypothetical protein